MRLRMVPAMSKLAQIAQEMRDFALENPGWASESVPTADHTKRLSGGLIISMWVNLRDWNLLLRREGVQPSIKELEVCVRDFSVPMSQAEILYYKQGVRNKTDHYVKLSWPHDLGPTPVKSKPDTGYSQRSLLDE